MAVAPLTDAAADADRLIGGVIPHIQIVGIDQPVRMGDVAAEPDGVAPDRGAEGAAGFGHIGGEAEIPRGIRRLRQLTDDPARRLKRLMNVPQRAGAAITGELKPRRGVAFGDGSGLIDA